MQKVEQSILVPAVVEARVIPNGVDLSIFHPAEKRTIRDSLNISQNAQVLLFTADSIQWSYWKDHRTMQVALALIAERLKGRPLLFIGLGENASVERIGHIELHFVPFQNTQEAMARYYQAADIYVHPAKADTFPSMVLEALACGTPVVATSVGGIPEQVKGFQIADDRSNGYDIARGTGVLVKVGDAEEMANAIIALLTKPAWRERLGENAAQDVQHRFDLEMQVDTYLRWYQLILRKEKLKPNLS